MALLWQMTRLSHAYGIGYGVGYELVSDLRDTFSWKELTTPTTKKRHDQDNKVDHKT